MRAETIVERAFVFTRAAVRIDDACCDRARDAMRGEDVSDDSVETGNFF